MRLPIQRRLALLLGAVVLIVGLALALLDHAQRGQLRLMFAERVRQTAAVLDRVVEMKQRSLVVHADDYSRWDEFVDFVRRPDREWGRVNLDESIATFSLDYAWVLDAQGRAVYATAGAEGHAPATPPVAAPVLAMRVTREHFMHFFAGPPEAPLELWTAPIQPSSDFARSSPPAGYYVIARRWTPEVLEDQARVVGGHLALVPRLRGARPPRSSSASGRIEVARALLGIDGAPVAEMRLVADYPIVKELERSARRSLVMLAVVSLLVLVLAHGALVRWVAGPVHALSAAVSRDDPAPLGPLTRAGDEFGRLATLITESFRQRDIVVREVRDRLAAEQTAAHHQALLREVVDHDPNPIYVTGPDGRLTLVNHAAARLFGLAPEKAVGRCAESLLGPLGCRDSFHASREEAILSGTPSHTEERATLPGGGVRQLESFRCALPAPDGTAHLLTISVDVTERARHTHELERARAAAEAGEQAKARLLANASHELRTPLHGILSFARFGERECGRPEHESLQGYFRDIRECGDNLLALLNDLLDLARLESGRLQFERAPMDLTGVIESAAEEFEPRLRDRGIRLELALEDRLPMVRGDRLKLLQVMRNLLANAIHFSPAGGAVRVQASAADDRVRVSVCDDGPGIPPDELEQVFQPFVQASSNPGESGTGLGLAISREILQAHDGTIHATNKPGGGACFVFEVPVEDARGERAA